MLLSVMRKTQASANSNTTSVPQQAPANANFSSQQTAPQQPTPLFSANNNGGGDLGGGTGFVGGMVAGTNGNLPSSTLVVGGVVGPSAISPRTPAAANRQFSAAVAAANPAEQLRRGGGVSGVTDGGMSVTAAAAVIGDAGGGVVGGGGVVLTPSPDGGGGMRSGVAAGASPGPVALPPLQGHRLPPQVDKSQS